MKLMTHIVGGYPTMKECEAIALTMVEAGVSYLEIQIPFSDPIADGRTILKANTKALQNGITPEDCFRLMKKLKRQTNIPLLFMTYYNIPFRYGLEKFCKKAKEIGCYGLIIPDIPIDEEKYENYLSICKKHKLHAIQVISPLTPEARLKKITKVASGFVYCVSSSGTTGERKNFSPKLDEYLKRVRKHIHVPIALGFGISRKSHIGVIQEKVDIAIIGSKLINLYNTSKENKLQTIKSFLKKLTS